jgi:branched-subunit amino acid transport protein
VSEGTLWGLIIAMALVTFVLRSSFIVLQDRIRLPSWFRRGMAYVPAAVLAAITAPAFVQLGGDVDLAVQAPRWAAGVVGALVAVRTGDVVAVLAAGMLTLWGVQALLR